MCAAQLPLAYTTTNNVADELLATLGRQAGQGGALRVIWQYIFSSALRCCVLPKIRKVKIKLISQNNINIQYIYIYYNIFIRALMAPGGVCIAVSRLLCHQIIILYCIWFVQQLSLFACCGIWSCGQAYAFIHTVYIHTSTASAS